MNVLILQPPLLQLNTAYPSGAYLKAFFNYENCNTKWVDLNNKFFYEIFSKKGLTKLFTLSQQSAQKKIQQYISLHDDISAFNIQRYLSQKNQWISYIESITDILCCKTSTQEIKHNFIFSPFSPRGARMDSYLENLDHNLTTDDAFSLASLAIADLADYINIVFDSNFSLIRYAENLTVTEDSFEKITQACTSNIIRHFYIPMLQDLFNDNDFTNCTDLLVCISIPFAGTFTPALATGKYFKQQHPSAKICMGGGFINTELRNTVEPLLAEYTDYLSYDRGYGSYHALLNKKDDSESIYKLKQFIDGKVISQTEEDLQLQQLENKLTAELTPDFSDIDFSIYPRMTDDQNPMHRLWNDGAWMKIYLAHGCYWHKCAFCDTSLDYIKNYKLTNISKLYDSIYKQALAHKSFGIHLVDEAAPPSALVQFAKKNLDSSPQLNFWGNVRFEKNFTRDITDFLAAGGLVGVSGGIEIATGHGLDSINKGTDIDSIVSSCCAFKESGILVHAYMIYGYWNQTEQDIIDSMETLRQFFANGILDSSFWHKFVLTKHSTVYQDYLKNPDKFSLKPIESKNQSLFCQNGIHFEGENKFDKYGPSLDSALDAWMHGEELDTPVIKWFNFKVCSPKIKPDFISSSIQKYEYKRDSNFNKPLSQTDLQKASSLISSNTINSSSLQTNEPCQKIYWLGGQIIENTRHEKTWFYMNEKYTAPDQTSINYFRGKGLCILPF